MTKLGLTTYYKSDSFAKKFGGYNFAFVSGDRSIPQVARQTKYGKEAVMFRTSGIEVQHYGDREYQAIFYGPAVSPKEIVYLRNEDGEWSVVGKKDWKPYYSSDRITDVINWVEKNWRQYKRKIFEGKSLDEWELWMHPYPRMIGKKRRLNPSKVRVGRIFQDGNELIKLSDLSRRSAGQRRPN